MESPKTYVCYSRHGKPFILPQEIIDAMPQNVFLDGELWYVLSFDLGITSSQTKLHHQNMYLYIVITDTLSRFGQDCLKEAMKISHRMNDAQIDWKRFKFIVFDSPNTSGSYQERYSTLGKQFDG